MPYPQAPEIQTTYQSVEQALGDGSLPGQELDVDLAAIRASITQTIEFVKGITRSDGRLANGSVTSDTLASSLIIGFDPPAPWATGTAYTTKSTVFEGYGFYLCLTAHTSGVFATDLASQRWVLLADLTPPGGALIASNNLSDLADTANARTNLGLGTMATASATAYRTNVEQDLAFQPILTGLTASVAELNFTDGVTSPIQTQLNTLSSGKQAAGATLTSLEGLALAQGDTLYATAADTLARLPKGAAGQTFAMNAGATAPEWRGGEVAPVTASGTSVPFSSVPTTARKLTIYFNALSLGGTDNALVQIGTGGAAETSGYNVMGGRIDNTVTATATVANGFFLQLANAANGLSGFMTLEKEPGSNAWHCTALTGNLSVGLSLSAGRKSLAGALDYFRVVPTGANSFDGGTVSYRWE
jgi:hypothetical protein